MRFVFEMFGGSGDGDVKECDADEGDTIVIRDRSQRVVVRIDYEECDLVRISLADVKGGGIPCPEEDDDDAD